MKTARPVFFYHIPKTAGDTLRNFLLSRPDSVCPAYTWTTLLSIPSSELHQYKIFSGHFYGQIEQQINTDLFKFSLLRDPLERAFSHYGHVIRDPSHYLHRRATELGSFQAYLEDPLTRTSISNFQSRMLAINADVKSIYQGMTDTEKASWALEKHLETTDFGASEDQILWAAKARITNFDLIGITERLSEFIALLCLKLSWPYPKTLVSTNINIKRPKHEEQPDQIIETLKNINNIDIALYDWAKDRFDEQLMLALTKTVTYNALPRWKQLFSIPRYE